MTKNTIIAVLVAALLFGLGGWYAQSYFQSLKQIKSTENSQVLLEKIKTVCKMITVEGYFSEVYDYKDYWGYNLSPFQKKALMRIKAKVSIGYDMEQMKIEIRELDKTILISELPEPTILSIDHELDYYDISEGSFNSFTEEDYNKMSKNAKNKIREEAYKSDLFATAKKQSNQQFKMVEFMAESAGWKVEYIKRKPSPFEKELAPVLEGVLKEN